MPSRRSKPRRPPPSSPSRATPAPDPGRALASTSARPFWTHPALGAALIGFLIYLPALGGAFLRDDHFLIEHHPYLRATGWLGRLLLSDFWGMVSGATGMWRPLVVLSYWIDGRLGDWTPFWFHVVNAIAHGLASGALALLIAASGAGMVATWLASLAFATMPAHVECVAWISGRTDVFCALFGLTALWLDARARRAGRAWPGPLALLALVLSLLSKEVGVALVAVLAVQEWSRGRATAASLGRSAAWLAPYLAVTAIYIALHLVLTPDPGASPISDPQRRATTGAAAWSLFPGWIAFLWPWFPHSPDRAAPAITADGRLETVAGMLGVAFLTGLLGMLVWRRSRHAAPLALLMLPLAPTLVLAATRGFGLFGERHMYVPSAGVVWALALAIPAAAARFGGPGRTIAGALAAVLVAGSAVETLRAIPDYRDDGTMYRAMTVRDPGNPAGFLGLAVVLTERGELDQALAMLDRAERIDPGLAGVYSGRARVAARRGAWSDVLNQSGRALVIDPRLQSARLLRAVALMQLRRLEDAGRELDTLRAEDPDHPGVATVWGQYLIATGRPAEALPVLMKASELLPREASLWDAIGMANATLDRREEARAAFERVIAITPDYLEGWMRLAASCHRLGDAAARNRALERAAALPGGRARVDEFLAPLGGRAP